MNSVDLRALTHNALDYVPSTGTLKMAVFLWATDGVLLPIDTLVVDGKVSLKLFNPYSSNVSVTAVRFLVYYA